MPVAVFCLIPITGVRWQGVDDDLSTTLNASVKPPASGEVEEARLFAAADSAIVYLQHLGYLQAKVQFYATPGPMGQEAVFAVQTGPLFKCTLTRLKGSRYISQTALWRALGRDSTTVTPVEDLYSLPQKLVNVYAERGYLFAQVTLDSLQMQNNELHALLTIVEGQPFRPVRFMYSGNKVTKPGTLIRAARLQSGKLYTYSDLAAAEDRLRSKPWVNDCRLLPADERTLAINLEEGPMTSISGVLAYNAAQDVKPGDRLSGTVDLKFYNLWGSDRNLALYWQKNARRESQIKLTWQESGWGNLTLPTDFSFSRFQADTIYVHNAVDSDVYYYIDNNRLGLALGWEDYRPGSAAADTLRLSNYKIGANWLWEVWDTRLNPAKGSSISVAYTRFFNNDGGRGSWSMETQWAYPFGRLVLYNKTGLDYTEAKNLRYVEYFKLGGGRNLRGFEQDIFRSTGTAYTQNELRLLTGRLSRVFLFCDYGWVDSTGSTKRLTDLFSVGMGLRASTRLGIMAIDYGLPHQEGRWRNINDGMISFYLETEF